MRKYVSQCVDEKTGLILVLSDVSYNMAMDWLQRQAEKYFKEIYRCEMKDGMVNICVGTLKKGEDFNGNPCIWFTDTITFYYEEERGVLLQE